MRAWNGTLSGEAHINMLYTRPSPAACLCKTYYALELRARARMRFQHVGPLVRSAALVRF